MKNQNGINQEKRYKKGLKNRSMLMKTHTMGNLRNLLLERREVVLIVRIKFEECQKWFVLNVPNLYAVSTKKMCVLFAPNFFN